MSQDETKGDFVGIFLQESVVFGVWGLGFRVRSLWVGVGVWGGPEILDFGFRL